MALGRPQSQHKGKAGGVQECQPPKPCEGPCSTSWGAEGQGPGCSPRWGDLKKESSHTSDTGVFSLVGSLSAASYLLPSCLSLDTCCCIYQGATLSLAQAHATRAQRSRTAAQACLRRLPPIVRQAPGPASPHASRFPPLRPAYAPSAQPKIGALVSATGMEASAPWQHREREAAQGT